MCNSHCDGVYTVELGTFTDFSISELTVFLARGKQKLSGSMKITMKIRDVKIV